MYTEAPVLEAYSAKNWQKARRLELPSAGSIFLKIDTKDVFHILYTVGAGGDPGVYYTRSVNRGVLWSTSYKLDPDIPGNHSPADLQFQIDSNDNLHAVWYYVALDFTGADWVRYTHSLDGGETWSAPFTIDKVDQGVVTEEEKLNDARARLFTNGETVHIIWATRVGSNYLRNHRYSNNSGDNWSMATRVFGDLNGQAGDGFALDGAGRVHFFSQIRFPRGIWHMTWDAGEWSLPSLVYLISLDSGDPFGDRIHAHRTYPIIRAGNQIVLTFTDPPGTPGRRLFAIQRTLDDVEPIALQPTPTPTAIVEASNEITSQQTPEATGVPVRFQDNAGESSLTSGTIGVWIGSAISLIVSVGILLYWILFRQKH
jgi:hypothetical protein